MRVLIMIEKGDLPKPVAQAVRIVMEALPDEKVYLAQDGGHGSIGWEFSAIKALESIRNNPVE